VRPISDESRTVADFRARTAAVLDAATLHRALADLRSRGVRIGVSTPGPGQADAVR